MRKNKRHKRKNIRQNIPYLEITEEKRSGLALGLHY